MDRVVPGRYEVRFGVLEVQQDIDRVNAWLLSVGGVAQSYLDLDDPTHLEFDYMRRIGDVIDLLVPGPLRVLHIGGGAGTLARYVAATRPGSVQRIVDADDLLVEVMSAHFGLREIPGTEVAVGGGRAALRDGGTWDVVVIDAFEQATPAVDLVTLESLAEVKALLGPSGVVLLNTTDGPGMPFAKRVVGTVRASFGHQALVGDPAILRGRRFANVVIAASDSGLPVADMAARAAAAAFPARTVADEDLTRFTGEPLRDGEDAAPIIPPPGLFH